MLRFIKKIQNMRENVSSLKLTLLTDLFLRLFTRRVIKNEYNYQIRRSFGLIKRSAAKYLRAISARKYLGQLPH